MKKVLLSLAAVASVAAAAPAMAQPVVTFSFGSRGGDYYNGYGYGAGSINQREQRIAWEIRRGEQTGRLNWREARDLRNGLMRVEQMERQYAWNGLSRAEYIDLSRRLSRLENRVEVAMNDYDNDRYDRYGYGYGYGY
jgi:hypothetical protein